MALFLLLSCTASPRLFPSDEFEEDEIYFVPTLNTSRGRAGDCIYFIYERILNVPGSDLPAWQQQQVVYLKGNVLQ